MKRDYKRTGNMQVTSIFIIIIFSQVHMYGNTYQIIHFKYLRHCELYLNNPLLFKIEISISYSFPKLSFGDYILIPQALLSQQAQSGLSSSWQAMLFPLVSQEQWLDWVTKATSLDYELSLLFILASCLHSNSLDVTNSPGRKWESKNLQVIFLTIISVTQAPQICRLKNF